MANKKKQGKKPQAPDPFLPERDESELPDLPNGWSDLAPSNWLFPLHWFLSDVDNVHLNVCVIRRLNPPDIDEMRAAEKQFRIFGTAIAGFPGHSQWSDFSGREFPWVIQMRLPPGQFASRRGFAHYIRRSVEAALRIVSHRYVFASSPILYQPEVEDSLAGQYVLTPSDFPDFPASLKYHLANEHVQLLQRVHKAALDTQDGRVRMAIRRFLRGYGRGGDDSLIDLWIGLEALFGDRRGEITYKAAMRIAHYTGQGSRLFRDLQDSYNVRSALVHGDHPATKSARLVARNALRFSLLKLLAEGAIPDVRALDNSIAAGGSAVSAP